MSDEKNIVPIEKLLPQVLNLIPLAGRPIFPGVFTPMLITDEEDVRSVEQAYAENGFLGFCLVKSDEESTHSSELYMVGTVGKIVKKINLPDGGINIFVSTHKRFRVTKVLSDNDPIKASVKYLEDTHFKGVEVKALLRSLITEMKILSENNPLFSEEMRLNMVNIGQPGKAADFITSILNIKKEEQQKILETLNVRERMESVFLHIQKEKEFLDIQKKIQHDLNTRVEKNQRDYFLREELKSIKKELGLSTDPKIADEKKFKEKIEELKLTGEVKEAVEAEYEKFTFMEPSSSEYNVSRNYLETILSLPWNDTDPGFYDLAESEKILNGDHFGLEDVKKRIIEYLAVRKLKNDNKGSIILLVGPPGVGKTSVGMSISKAMNKKFFRFSVGGMRDEAEIKGHRRTYIGAMPGKILQGLKITKTKSPVFMIDEIDKMGESYHGDPSSALLEVLDPEQNISFRDHYLDLPFDLSNIVFILTANTTDTIPRPLLDRAEVIRIAGYISSEKVEIAKKFLIPKSLKKHGLKRSNISYNKSTLLFIANSYARESGVRGLEKNIDKIHRKLATQLVKEERKQTEKLVVDTDVLTEMLGKPIFRNDMIQAKTPGTAIGLAWTGLGGDTLLIEAIVIAGKGQLKLTGQMGNVMKESANIAWSWLRSYAVKNELVDDKWFETNFVHIHIPEGATPKDGPSAGITMTTALVSLFEGITIKPNLAMTGELSLTGRVLPIGGLKEKTIAAKRNAIKEIIIPKANTRDLDEIPEHIKKGIKFFPVTSMDEVLEIAIPKKKKVAKKK
ncbi:MAG: endopeptidase La [Treponema sp.]|nr:MAG: endopeptidase La [Treponema sp.]